MYSVALETENAKPQKLDNWSRLVLVLLLGYSLVGRSFAYVGLPPAKLFIGEMSLAAFIFFRSRNLFDPWIKALTKGGPLGPLAWVLLGSITYGIFEVIRGILIGFSPITAIENLVFNIYPIYFFLGLWVGARRPDVLLKYFRLYAIIFCIYAPAYVLVLNKVRIAMPGSDGVPMFGQAGGGGLIILGILSLDPKPSRYWLPLTVAAAMLLAGQVRAEWVGMGLAMLIWGVLSRKMTVVAGVAAGVVAILIVGFALDVNLPAPADRGGSISSREIVARGLAAVSPEMAQDMTGSGNVGFYNGTITWRETWWRAIWANSQKDYTNFIIGPGYGFVLKGLVNYLKDQGDLRTPHSIFYYALGYSGWLGVCFFFSLQACCGLLVWRVYKLTGQAFGLAFWASTLFPAFFGNAFETPTGAVPCYLTLGLVIGPTLAMVRSSARASLRPQPYSVAYVGDSYVAEGSTTERA